MDYNENSTIAELLREFNQICNNITDGLKRILGKTANRSCLTPMKCKVLFPFEYDKNACYGMKGTAEFGIHYCIWAEYIHNTGNVRRFFEECRESVSDEKIEKAINELLLITK